MSLTPRERELVQSSWELAKKDIRGTGVELLLMFLERNPTYQKFFSFRDIPLNELRDNKKFIAHGLNVMYALCAIIDNLDTDILPDLLEKNANTHAPRGIPPEAYDNLGTTVIALFKKLCTSAFTEETEKAWTHLLENAFTLIKSKLKSK